MKNTRINVGLLGLGRLGKVYARSLSSLVPHTDLVAVCDVDQTVLDQVADEYQVPSRHSDPLALIGDSSVEVVVIVTPTDTHKELVDAAADAGKPVFCEKPLSISLDEALAMQRKVERSGIFFQMGFMRRFDRGYAAAKEKIERGLIGSPVVFKSSSRDPFLPSLDYLNTSGGIFVDMGIHDFDLALWFFGKIEAVNSIGGALAYPEVKPLGDIDNAVVSLAFADGRVGVVDLSRNGVYGYDISTEILGTNGTLRIGYLRETPILFMTQNSVAHDTVPYFMERFGEAYTSQLSDFANNLLRDKPPPITIEDGIEALRVATSATASYQRGESVKVESVG
jgi:inositol 2-dehydrogenase